MSRVKIRFIAAVLLGLILMFGAGLGLRADELATLTGRVTDAQGLALPGVKVEAININTNVTYPGESNGEGIYQIPNVSPGVYRVVLQKTGFSQVVKPGVELHVQDVITINFTMQVGSITQTVTVEAGAPMINTTDASVSTVIDQSYVKNMPLNGRSFQDLILLTPGVVTQSPQSFGALGQNGEFSVNGQRAESNYYTVDGVSANVGATTDIGNVTGPAASGSLPGATALGTTQALVSVDELQEFRVSSSTYSAQYGRNPGGQFAFETKSGTNSYHGTAYDYFRNDLFDANDWFNDYFRAIDPTITKPALRQNDFGGTLGGPVRIPHLYRGKDKTFFFVSYEGLRLLQPQPAITNVVPDQCLRGQASACTGGNTSAVAAIQPALNAFPLPNGQDFGDGQAEFIANWSNPGSIDSTSVRIDHVINDKVKLFFRFNNTNSDQTTRGSQLLNGLAPSVNLPFTSVVRSYTGGVSTAFSSRWNNEFRLNYTSNVATQKNVLDGFGGAQPINMVQLSGLSGDGSGSQAAFFLCYDACSAGELIQSVVSGAQRQWNVVDTVALTVGRHQLKFGGDFRRLTPYAVPVPAALTYGYFAQSDAVNNNATFFSGAENPAYPLFRNFSAFAQDEWRVAPRLSLSMGLRWEVNPPPGVTQGLMPYTLVGSTPDTLTLAPQGTPLYKTAWFNLAPRLGMAYVLRDRAGWETVVRAGGGVFFDTGQQLGSQGFFGPGFSAFGPVDPACSQGPFPFTPSSTCSAVIPTITQPPSAPFDGAFGFSPHLQLPYTLQWNASVEQALGKSQTFTATYTGSHASRLLQTNQYDPTNNPDGTSFLFLVQNGQTSDFDSLQLQFRRRLSQGLTALGSYSWSHCLDYGSIAISIGFQRGNCTWDVRHNVSTAFSYDVPNVAHNRALGALLHHWGLDDRFTARTGFPVTLEGSSLPQPNGKVYNAGLSLVPGQPVYLYGANCASVLQGLGDLQVGQGCPGGMAINPNAFQQPSCTPSAPVCFGDAPRNFARGFGAWQMDLAVRREFPIYENLKLQFRTEAFNIFNHPNFGRIDSFCFPNPTTGVGCLNPTFGQTVGTLAGTLGVLSSQYQQGGARSMQFALKLVF